MSHFKLLSVNKDAKTVKGKKKGILTGVLYLAPHTTAGIGVNLCPRSTKACREVCLYTAGRGSTHVVQKGRVRKTKLLFEDTGLFLAQLRKDIEKLVRKANREGLTPAIRLNGTSDIAWEKTGLMDLYPEVQFYDYTKLDLEDRIPRFNYHLTFSVSESKSSWTRAKKYLDAGANVSVVFATKEDVQHALEHGYRGYPALNGDDSDVRFFDAPGHVVALTAKGKARRDQSGFVQRLVGHPALTRRAA